MQQAHCIHLNVCQTLYLNSLIFSDVTCGWYEAVVLTQTKALKKSPFSPVSSVVFLQNGGGMNTDGSLIPRMMLKKLKQSDKTGFVSPDTQWNRLTQGKFSVCMLPYQAKPDFLSIHVHFLSLALTHLLGHNPAGLWPVEKDTDRKATKLGERQEVLAWGREKKHLLLVNSISTK